MTPLLEHRHHPEGSGQPFVGATTQHCPDEVLA
jgi:hypothetical protein